MEALFVLLAGAVIVLAVAVVWVIVEYRKDH